MPKWTEWRKLAKGEEWWDDFDNDGASCYELGLKASKGREIVRVYVGHAKNENYRMWDYGYRGSHLAKPINKALKNHFTLYFRGQAKNTLKQAIKMELKLLSKRYYAWNKKLR